MWQIAGQIRVSPFPPYKRIDLVKFEKWLKEQDVKKIDNFNKIKTDIYNSNLILLDSVVVKNKLLIFTFSGEAHYGELDRGQNYNDVVFKIYDVEKCRPLDARDPTYLYLHGFSIDE
jgi:hypothetical protein